MSIKTVLKTVGGFLSDKAPVILTGLGVGGLITTAVLSVKAGMNTKEILDEYDFENMDKKDRREVLITEVAPQFIPPAFAGVASAACIIGGQVKSYSKLALLSSVYAMKEQDLDALKDKMKEFLGEKDHQKLTDALAEDKANENLAIYGGKDSAFIQNTMQGDTLIVDLVTGVVFRGSIEKVRSAVNDINEMLLQGDVQTLNDFYYILKLDGCKIGECIGWENSRNGLLSVAYSACLLEGEPAITIDYDWDNLISY